MKQREKRYKFVPETLKEAKPDFYICMLMGKNMHFPAGTKVRDCNLNEFKIRMHIDYPDPDFKYTGIVVCGKVTPQGDYFVILQ